MKHPALLFAALVISVASFAQNAHLVRLDTAALNTMHVGEGVPTTDGGSVFQTVDQPGFSLWKCDAAGIPQWSNHYPPTIPYGDWDIAPTANGDVLLAYSSAIQSPWGDTTIPALELWRITQDGAVVWRKNIALDTLFTFASSYDQRVSVAEDGDGGIFILTYADMNWMRLVTVTKVDPSGDVLWSRRIGDPDQSMNFPSASPSMGTVYLAPDGVGGCRVVAMAAEMSESVNVMSVTADGSLAWGKLFDYLGNGQGFTMAAPAVAENGNALFFTSNNTMDPNGGLHLVRISEDGDLLSVEQYEPSVYCADLINDQGTLLRVDDQRVVSMTETGDFLAGVGFTSLPANEDSTYHLSFNHLAVKNGRACFAGTFTAVPTGVGLPLVSPAISSFDITGTACGLLHWTQEATHTALPSSIFTCDPMASIAADTVELTVSDGILSFEPRPVLGATDLCIYTSIPPEPSSGSAFTVSPTLLMVGDPLTVISDQPLRYSLMDVKGAAVWNDAHSSQRLDIPTAELTPGLYMLLGRDVSGQLVGRSKVVVER